LLRYGKAADSECSSVCSGDGAACGASSPLRTSVYSVSSNISFFILKIFNSSS